MINWKKRLKRISDKLDRGGTRKKVRSWRGDKEKKE
jgi:hypothetical protein